MRRAAKDYALAHLAGLALLYLGAWLLLIEEAGAQPGLGCGLYRQGELTNIPIGVYRVPEVHGGTMERHELTVRPEYLSQPWSDLSAAGELDHTALFEVEIESGSPPLDPRRTRPLEQTHLVLLLTGRAYGSPTFSLGALAGAPVGAPLTVPKFKIVGPGPAGFSEILVEEQAEYVMAQSQLFAELSPDGELTALLKCDRPYAVPNPTCQLVEHIGVFDSDATFRRIELPRLDLVRERVAGFTACLTEK